MIWNCSYLGCAAYLIIKANYKTCRLNSVLFLDETLAYIGDRVTEYNIPVLPIFKRGCTASPFSQCSNRVDGMASYLARELKDWFGSERGFENEWYSLITQCSHKIEKRSLDISQRSVLGMYLSELISETWTQLVSHLSYLSEILMIYETQNYHVYNSRSGQSLVVPVQFISWRPPR